MKISVLVPYKPDNGERDTLWEFVRNRYEKLMPDLELCVGIDDSPIFNKSVATNKAAKLATGDIFIVADSDVIYDIELIDLIRKNIENRQYLIPFTKGVRLNKEATMRILTSDNESGFIIYQTDIQGELSAPGSQLNVVTREAFEKVKGFDERFIGWGYEDLAFIASLKAFYGNPYRIDAAIFHLWHTPAREKKDYDFEECCKKNYKLFIGYRMANTMNKMRQLINGKYLRGL